MRFLIKFGFWMMVVLLFIPLGSGPKDGAQSTVGAAQAYTAAQETIGDLGHFCQRQPDVCRTGRAALQTAGIRAKEGAKLAYEFLDRHFGTPGATPDAIETGSIAHR